MADAGCGGSRCCFDEGEGVSACWHWSETVGFFYDEDMSPANHYDCWVGISYDGSSSQTGCRKCEHGCHGFEDDFIHLFVAALWEDGESYLRSEIGHQFGRNAKNQIFDLRTNTPTLIQRRCRLEHGSCYENNPLLHPGGWVCWGHHVCQCTPEPDWVDPCPTAIDVGYPVSGPTPTTFFFNYQGWPPDTHGTLPGNPHFCRKWHPSNGGSPRNAAFYVHRGVKDKGPVHNASFLRSREGMNIDALVPCAGFIAPSSCINPTSGDCTYGGTRPEGDSVYINRTQPSSQGKFEELWIDLPSVDIRMRELPSLSAQQLREQQLYKTIFAEAIGRAYPHPEGGYLNMDRVAMHLPSNDYLGRYERTWNGADWEEGDLPIIIRFPYCRTRWGRVPLVAQMVITYCKIIVNLTVPHFAEYVRGPDPNKHWIKPFATVEIRVHTAMQCYMAPTGITVGGEPVTLANPTWVSGKGYDGIPTATPDGNEIIYATEKDERGRPLPVRPFRKYRWFGRLGSFSSPVTEETDFDYANMNCEDLIDLIGMFTVPALATANESHPDDPNRNYAGSIAFHFSHQA